ncbi:hypothetical protein OG943_42905 [Amycolatopsis sp. NBC_00345]|uniref:hypothetical protein n=1 Tax=Amycolatopsis sp. NBC_00345 TaxID=2975955 RepID=UPI002E25ECDA
MDAEQGGLVQPDADAAAGEDVASAAQRDGRFHGHRQVVAGGETREHGLLERGGVGERETAPYLRRTMASVAGMSPLRTDRPSPGACFPMGMLRVKRANLPGHRYEVTQDGRQLPELALRRGSIDGTGYRVRKHRFSGVYDLLAENDEVLASTDRVRRRLSPHLTGRDVQFRQSAFAGREYSMLGPAGDATGTIRRDGMAGAGASADLPGLSTELQLFAVVAVLLSWRRRRTAATARGGAAAGG